MFSPSNPTVAARRYLFYHIFFVSTIFPKCHEGWKKKPDGAFLCESDHSDAVTPRYPHSSPYSVAAPKPSFATCKMPLFCTLAKVGRKCWFERGHFEVFFLRMNFTLLLFIFSLHVHQFFFLQKRKCLGTTLAEKNNWIQKRTIWSWGQQWFCAIASSFFASPSFHLLFPVLQRPSWPSSLIGLLTGHCPPLQLPATVLPLLDTPMSLLATTDEGGRVTLAKL